MKNKEDLIIDIIKDMVNAFLYRDRKDDAELGIGEIEKLIEGGVIEIDDICWVFETELRKSLKDLINI